MKNRITFPFLFLTAVALLPFASQTKAQDQKVIIQKNMEGHIFRPAKVDPTDANIKQLKLPAGFTVNKFAEGLGKPRMLAVTPDGSVYVTSRDEGTVTLLQDKNKDGKAEVKKVVAQKENMHGITLHNGKAYLMTVNEVYTATLQQDGSLGPLQEIMKDFPDAGQHADRTLAFGPDGQLYISVGSTCNACPEPNKENATMVVASADGKTRREYAKGLRNTIGFDWHPQTKQLFGFDHGMDWMGDEEAREELNQIKEGANYGWPYVYENGVANLSDEPKGGQSWEEYAKQTQFPVLLYKAHSAPIAMFFYTGSQFPKEYNGDAFVTMHGSWNRAEPSGYKVVRVKFQNGQPKEFEDFLTGFLINDNKGQFGRPTGLAQHTDGSLLISDDANGVIYRVAYTGKKK